MEATIMDPKAITVEILVAALVAAKEAALAAAPGDDGGSCNMDTPLLRLKGVRQTVIDQAAVRAGVEIGEPLKGFWRGWRFVWTPRDGQANKRSRMSHAAFKSLQASGLDAHEWLQCD